MVKAVKGKLVAEKLIKDGYNVSFKNFPKPQ